VYLISFCQCRSSPSTQEPHSLMHHRSSVTLIVS
jgi:hypothetical protein